MIGQPGAQQIVGIDHANENTITQGWHYGLINNLILTLETFEITMEDLCIIGTSASYY